MKRGLRNGTIGEGEPTGRLTWSVLVWVLGLVSSGCSAPTVVASLDSGPLDSGHDAGNDVGTQDAGHTVCPGPELCQRDPFVPPFATSGTTGWQTSTGEVCSARNGRLESAKLLADSRGVFALVSSSLDPENFFFASTGWELKFNNGAGWSTIFTQLLPVGVPAGVNQLALAPDGSLMIVSPTLATGSTPCGILNVDINGVSQCILENEVVERISFAPDGRVFAIIGGGVSVYSSGSWTQLFTAPVGSGRLTDLWTDGTTTLAVGFGQTVIRFVAGGIAELLSDAPAGNYTRVAATGGDNAFIGTQTGQIVRFDGTGFTLVETGLPICEYGGDVTGLWIASSGDLYVSAIRGMAKLPASGSPEILAQWSCEVDVSVLDVSGSDVRNERYYALRNAADTYRICGEAHLVVQDSSGFRLF